MNKPAQDMPEWKGYKIAYVDGLKAENTILREALEWIGCHSMDRDITRVAQQALQRAGRG